METLSPLIILLLSFLSIFLINIQMHPMHTHTCRSALCSLIYSSFALLCCLSTPRLSFFPPALSHSFSLLAQLHFSLLFLRCGGCVYVEIPAADLVFPGHVLCAFLCVLISTTAAVKLLCFNARVSAATLTRPVKGK